MLNVVKSIGHGLLECCSDILKTKRDLAIIKCAPRTDKGCFVLVFPLYMSFIIAREAIHEEKNFVAGTFINYLVNEWCWVVVLRTNFIKVSKISTDMNGALLLINGDWVINPLGQGNK